MEYYFCSRCGKGPFTWTTGTDICVNKNNAIRICSECNKSFKSWLKLGEAKKYLDEEDNTK